MFNPSRGGYPARIKFLSFTSRVSPSIGGEPKMKKRAVKKSSNLPVRFPLSFTNKKEREAYLASVQQLDEQSDRLGLMDPTETEPAILYSPWEGKR